MRTRALVVIATALAACADPVATSYSNVGPDTPAAAGMTYAWTFDQDAAGPLPAPWFSVLGDWRVDHGTLLQGGRFGDPDFPRVVYEGLQFTDLHIAVKCRMESGDTDRACGLVFRAVDSDNYYISRANTLEDNIRLYRVVDGNRQQLASASRTVNSDTWHTLEADATGGHLTVSWNGEQIIEQTDTTFTSGVIGVWTKADSITRFDELAATAR